MQRPRNQQGQPRHGRGGRQRSERNHERAECPSNVPGINQVKVGASVSMVLKIDQSTGREVQGTVANVLTSGNHPRGIKVRLVDGRIGRVQRMVNAGETTLGSKPGGSPENGESITNVRGYTHRHGDIRNEASLPASTYNLGDLLPANHPLNTEFAQLATIREDTMHTCPVCNKFTGDEIAVSHHVNSHFD